MPKTNFENLTYYTVIYKQRITNYNSHIRRHIGSYLDIRDAIQSIITAYRRNPNCRGDFRIEESNDYPRYGLISSRYNDYNLN